MDISIDLTDLYRRVDEIEGNIETFVQALVLEFAEQFREEVVVLATRQLSARTAPQYLEALSEVDAAGDMEAGVSLEGGFPSWIEEGRAPFIMPADDKVVPFFFWPHSQWKQRKKRGGTLINAKALQNVLGMAQTTQGTHTQEGGAAGFQISQYGSRLPAGLVGKRRKHHKTDLHAGMYRLKDPKQAKPGSKAISTGALGMTFRTHSEDWHHPGIKPRGFFDLAQRHVLERFDEIVDRVFEEWIF